MGRLVAAVVVVVLLAGGATAAWRTLSEEVRTLLPDECVAEVGPLRATLTPEQAENAALIAAIAVRRGLPARAVTIALATALQESRLRNIRYGDRDSLGLFQQRPSQGWGTRRQIMDPVYATHRFYDGLVRVEGYRDLRVTEAAQRVQRSAFPEAYGQHEPEARALASALSGASPHAFGCRVGEPSVGDPATVRDEVTGVFADLVARPVVTGSTLTVGVPGRRTGWALAHYLVAQADRLGVRRVEYAGRAWDGDTGWARDDSTLRRQVRVDVATV